MEFFDNFVNNYITPNSVPAGVGAVFLTFFTGKIAPKMPPKFYKLLDNVLVKILIVAFLLNQQIHQPSLSVIFSLVLVVGVELFIQLFAPDTPKLSEIVKPEDENKNEQKQQGCNCYCGSTIIQPVDKNAGNKNLGGNGIPRNLGQNSFTSYSPLMGYEPQYGSPI